MNKPLAAFDRHRSCCTAVTTSLFFYVGIYLAFRLWLLLYANAFSSDDGFMVSLARSLANGRLSVPIYDGWLRSSEYQFLHGIIAPASQAAMLKIFGGQSWFWSTKIPSLAAMAGLLACILSWARRTGITGAAFWVLFALLALDPLLFEFTTVLQGDLLMTLFFCIAVGFLLRYTDTGYRGYPFLAGTFAGFSALSFAPGIALLLIAPIVFWVFAINRREAVISGAIFAIGFAIICLPYVGWILSDEDRTTIFHAQYAQLGSSTPIAVKLAKWCTSAFSSLQGSSFGSLFILAAILLSATQRARESRFWLIVFVGGLFVMVQPQHASLAPHRIIALIPLAIYVTARNAVSDQSGTMRAIAVSSVILSLFYAILYASDHFILHYEIAINKSVLGLWLIALLSLVYWLSLLAKRRRYLNTARFSLVVFLIIIICCALSVMQQVIPHLSTRGAYTTRGAAFLKHELNARLPSKNCRIITDSPLAPFFPEHCTITAAELFGYPPYYRYFESYAVLTGKANPTFVVLSEGKLDWLRKDRNARQYLDQNFAEMGILNGVHIGPPYHGPIHVFQKRDGGGGANI